MLLCTVLAYDQRFTLLAHTSAGLYVAQARGYYAAAGLKVDFADPSVDTYKRTPASRVADGQATFAVAPSETVVSYNCQPATSSKPQLQVSNALYSHCVTCPNLLMDNS